MSNSRQLRDLAWVVNSASLITGGTFDAALDPTQVDSKHLAAFLADSRGYRVGRYFERLTLYWLKHIRGFEIVAESLPIRDGHRTIGEIDLLFYDENRRLIHWEIAVKFYLHFPQNNLLGSHYIGPNAGDTFERKMDRLYGHQLPRSETHFPEVDVRHAFVKGRIFYHPSLTDSLEPPMRLAPGHLRSVWIRSSEFRTLASDAGMRYRILRKPFWLSDEVADATNADLLSLSQITGSMTEHFSKDDRPVLLSRLNGDGPKFVELDRMFVVADHWPVANPRARSK